MSNRILKIAIIIYLIFFVNNFVLATTEIPLVANDQSQNSLQEKNINDKFSFLNEKVDNLKDNYQLLYSGVSNQNSQLGNQISFLGNGLGIFTIFLTILGIFLALYINNQYKKIKNIKNIVEKTREYIDNHNNDLYERIKRNEVESYLKRLEIVPEDVVNLVEILCSKNLLVEDYLPLKKAFLKLENATGTQYERNYVTLFTQHFPYLAVNDAEIRAVIINYINLGIMDGMFYVDIINYFDGILRYLNESGLSTEENKKIIKDLFFNYYSSKYREDKRINRDINSSIEKYNINKMLLIDIASDKKIDSGLAYLTWLKSL